MKHYAVSSQIISIKVSQGHTITDIDCHLKGLHLRCYSHWLSSKKAVFTLSIVHAKYKVYL